MSNPVAVVRFPGSNCDTDCLKALHIAGLPGTLLWHEDRLPPDTPAVILPGGFSYGDYLRPGAIARFSPIMQDVVRYAEAGGAVLGICNGMQILTEAGLLPGAMLPNLSGHFVCRWVHLRVESTDTIFTRGYQKHQVVRMPVAHGDGRWFGEGDPLVAFRYCGPDGSIDERFNPNGARSNIAGLTNPKGNVVGLMPHPERACDPLLGSEDGLPMFTSLVRRAVTA